MIFPQSCKSSIFVLISESIIRVMFVAALDFDILNIFCIKIKNIYYRL